MSSNREILSIFKFDSQEDADKLVYYTFLVMARAGVVRLAPSGVLCESDTDVKCRELWSGTIPRRVVTVRLTWSESRSC